MNRKIRKKWKITILCGILLLVWLCVANSVVVNLCVEEESRPTIGSMDDFLQKDEVVIAIKNEKNLSDMWDTYYIDGGAFCETEEEHLDRKIRLILHSDRNTYVISAIDTVRVDVYYEYEGIKKMPDGNIGFTSEFSTINIAHGTYELYIYVWENEEAYGITNSGHRFIKDKEGFRKVE